MVSLGCAGQRKTRSDSGQRGGWWPGDLVLGLTCSNHVSFWSLILLPLPLPFPVLLVSFTQLLRNCWHKGFFSNIARCNCYFRYNSEQMTSYMRLLALKMRSWVYDASFSEVNTAKKPPWNDHVQLKVDDYFLSLLAFFPSPKMISVRNLDCQFLSSGVVFRYRISSSKEKRWMQLMTFH